MDCNDIFVIRYNVKNLKSGFYFCSPAIGAAGPGFAYDISKAVIFCDISAANSMVRNLSLLFPGESFEVRSQTEEFKRRKRYL